MQEWPGQPVSTPQAAPQAAEWPGQPVTAQQTRPAAPRQPRGVRNRNEGNLKDGPFARRQPGYVGAEGGFAMFDTADNGNRAQEALLANNYIGAGFTTPRAIVDRYAPVGPENSQESVDNYVAHISRRLGIGENDNVSPQQVTTLAQAMREFENGSVPLDDLQDSTPPDPNRPTVGTGLDLEAIIRGETVPAGVEEVILDNAIRREGGVASILNQDNEWVPLGTVEEFDALPREEAQRRINRATSSRSAEYMAEYNASREAAENVPPWLANLAEGDSLGAATWVLGATNFLAPFTEGVDRGTASEAGRAAYRDYLAELAREDPVGSIGMRMAGGLLTPGLKQTGDWIAGAGGAMRTGRAAAVGAGYGGAAGVIGAEGDLGERARAGLLGAGVGAATGGLLDTGQQRAYAAAARRSEVPSAARVLSREGVELTPGQMLESTPLVGPMARGVEDALTGVPVLGPVVQGARNRGIETFNIAAINRALAPIGQRLPRSTTPGYGAVEEAQRRLGQAYDDVLPQVSARLDPQLYDDIARVVDDASAELLPDQVQQLGAVLQNRLFRHFEASDSPITGEQFKRIESELGALARRYRNGSDPTTAAFGDAISGVQNALRTMLARQNPSQAERIGRINEGYANLVRIERAAGSGPAQATDGVFSPTQLGVAVRQGGSRAEQARGGGLLQDLASAGRQALPSRIGDSGTTARGTVTGLLAGGAAIVNPQVAIPSIAVTVGAYSKPAQAALNALYRATDRQTADSALGELQRLAGRNPALQPYYRAAAEYVLRVFDRQSQEQEPAATGLLSPTRP